MNKKNKILLFLFVGVLIIAFTPMFGSLYELIIGRKVTTWFVGAGNPEYIEGFFISYMFFVSLFVSIFGGKNKYKIASLFLGILLLVDILLGALEGLIVDVGVILIGWLFGRGILMIKKKNK